MPITEVREAVDRAEEIAERYSKRILDMMNTWERELREHGYLSGWKPERVFADDFRWEMGVIGNGLSEGVYITVRLDESLECESDEPAVRDQLLHRHHRRRREDSRRVAALQLHARRVGPARR